MPLIYPTFADGFQSGFDIIVLGYFDYVIMENKPSEAAYFR